MKHQHTGRELYEVYASFPRDDQGITIDEWDDLPSEDRAAWDAVADHANR